MILIIQTTDDLQKVITTDSATVQGILLGLVIALGAATIYLYKDNKRMQKEQVQQLKEQTQEILKVNQMFSEFISNIKTMLRKDV